MQGEAMRIRTGNSSPWADDDANDPPLSAAFEDTPPLRHSSRNPPPPPPPPPPAPTDPTSYYTGVESGAVWKANLTTSTTDSAGNLRVTFSFPNAASDY